MPAVAVQIVTYNSAQTIAQTLSAVLTQTIEPHSLLVIDNASTDETVKIVQEMEIQLLQNTENIGYAAAHNQGLMMHTSDYVLTLNPDIMLEPDFIEQLSTVLEQNSDLGSASGCLLRTDNLDEPTTTVDACGLHMSRSRRQYLRYENAPIATVPDEPFPIMGPDGAAAFYRRAMLEDIMLDGEIFDTDFFMHKEDVDVCWRAQLLGWQSVCVPTARALHVRHFRPGQRSHVALDIRRIALRNRYLLMIKNDRVLHLLYDLPWIIAYDMAILGYVLLLERSSLSVYRDVLRLYRTTLHKRNQIIKRRRTSAQDMRQWFVNRDG